MRHWARWSRRRRLSTKPGSGGELSAHIRFMSSSAPRPLPANPFAWLLNDIETATDLDVIAPADPALLGRVLDGWHVLTLDEYAAARAEKDAA